ncbi:MAG: DNA polymerase III subunit chi [Betaproteobacteria bacterium]
MTQIDFYTHVSNKLQTACLVCSKALGRGMRVMILTPDADTTDKVDRMLWTHPATGFIPHVRARHRLAATTPVIVDHELAGVERDELLLNLRLDTPDVFSRFQRLVEIVSIEEQDIAAGRQRFRWYRDRGYEVRAHDISQGQSA